MDVIGQNCSDGLHYEVVEPGTKCDITDAGDRVGYAAEMERLKGERPSGWQHAIHWAAIQVRMRADHRLFAWRSDYLRGKHAVSDRSSG